VTFLKFSVSSINIVWRVQKAAFEVRSPNGFTISTNNLAGRHHQGLTSLQLPAASVIIFHRGHSGSRSWTEAAVISGDAYLDMYSPPKESPSKLTRAEFIQSQDVITNRTLWIQRGIAQRRSAATVHPVASFDASTRVHHINGLHLPQMQPCVSAPEHSLMSPITSDKLTDPRSPRSRLFSQSSASDGGSASTSNDCDAKPVYVYDSLDSSS
jgi:hypothetical protein